ncbi:hypothetical protein HNO53_20595 [Billgrantia antri]|uniref:Secreted protein n=1 Tax=Halomonas sulfidivorans TaxID=2733488 RepID=A0ABX7WRP9_9GAMM|nr:hypothetical protein [Halomonas sulfidivorans]QTP60899.1 hypothetical protein HNO53_20595 [Halomonas sulfidivorans]
MTPRSVLNTALAIVTVAALIAAMAWVTRHDEQVASASLEQYCRDAAIWAAEEARGVPLNERAGQPDHRDIAAEQCPGMRPALPAYRIASPGALPATTTTRQLAHQ